MDGTRRGMIGSIAAIAGLGCVSGARAAGAPALAEHPLVARVWHGRTPPAKLEAYRQYLFDAGVRKIAALPGNRGVQMLVTRTPDAGDFTVISFWDSVEAIKGYAGEDYTRVHDLPRDAEFLIDHEPLVRHYDLDVNFWQA